MLNALTIDVEDYFQVHAFSNIIKHEDWANYKCRIERNTNHLLNILNGATQNSALSTHNLNLSSNTSCNAKDYLSSSPCSMRSASSSVKATFFILGWIAERYPHLIKRIKADGHEIACHGYAHKLIYNQSKEEFREDIRKAKAILEDITGSGVIGYRAPSYSITNKSQWALEILAEEGFKYDSSIFPIRHDFYGFPNAPRFPFMVSLNGDGSIEFSELNLPVKNYNPQSLPDRQASAICNLQSIIEFPLSTVQLFGFNFPIAGGGYFRLFPYPLVKKGLKNINEKENKPFIFYVHPWEFDADQPRIKDAANLSKFRHYVNLNKTEDRFRKLLKDFNFSSVKDILELNNSLT